MLHGYMAMWLYGYMAIWLYGYMAIWLYGCMALWYDIILIVRAVAASVAYVTTAY